MPVGGALQTPADACGRLESPVGDLWRPPGGWTRCPWTPQDGGWMDLH